MNVMENFKWNNSVLISSTVYQRFSMNIVEQWFCFVYCTLIGIGSVFPIFPNLYEKNFDNVMAKKLDK